MDRRSFISKTAKTLALTAVPSILPTGSLFAATGSRKVDHVVLCLFAGGVRNIESMQMAEGNLIPYLIPGDVSVSPSIEPGMTPLPELDHEPLLNSGTLFKEFRFAKGPTGHISAHLTSLSGRYDDYGYNPKVRPKYATIFEYYRKHSMNGRNALNAWWVADRTDPFLRFNYSTDKYYGKKYAANFIQPSNILRSANPDFFSDLRYFDAHQMESVRKIQALFDRNAASRDLVYGINGLQDKANIQEFILKNIELSNSPSYADPWGMGLENMNNDMHSIHYSMKILEHFKPEFLTVNMMEVDRGHTDFTLYCDNMRKASFAVSRMWQMIQGTEGLKNNTAMIIVPEFGRNLKPNTLRDAYGRFATDHTNDATSREIFCMILGPEGVIKHNNVIDKKLGESIDIVPTVAELLGFNESLPFDLEGRVLTEAFVQ